MEAKEQRNQIKVPPILGDIEDELRDLLSNPERLSIHDWENSQNIWSREKNILSLFNYKTTPAQSSIKPIREHSTGQIIGWKEVISNTKIKGDDLSMNRPLLPPQSATQGTANQLPFLPAGYENMPVQPVENIEEITNPADTVSGFGMFMNEELLWIPPTLTNGILFGEDGFTPLNVEGDNKIEDKYNKPSTSQNDSPEENMDLQAIIEKENRLIGFWTDDQNVQTNKEESKPKPKTEENSLLDECINMPLRTVPDLPVLNISTNERRTLLKSTEWAEMLDISKPVVDFEKKVPQMAHTFPFELDTFQKQAILKLEEQGHVFVAAHTSAGKTVVAEYAIALSKKHCTRTVYTSPIKALSNQKYRDFSLTFGDVGLITGDLQINTTASCLVMTTEILRSMLYRGSDVIRDLEYVIFDEVHYINNVERGYVWEEVLILLPSHVSIVMLSATVPNTLEFADWVGRTKKRKVYVVSTLKRPVPLCHYLYTGSSGSSKDEKFLIIDQNGLFAPKGYEQAVQAKKQRSSNYNRDFGARGPRNHLTPNQEQTMWVAFISHLQDKQLLPVVAFVLSRNRCDITSEALRSVDLTTAREKGRIHTFIQICLKRLKEPDRNLPQVLRMISLLANGIGVHHSGILPILKEIVEMLFQNGLVKILFATETFAMGVNMPARTVIFDSVLKFDGTQMRSLLPAEYIQMAGRAGRRGLDDTGAVIILCKKDVPDNYVLKEMMQGKPMKLSSQFRVTYSTMLSLLRATSVSVESVMQRSFREFDLQCKAETYKQQLEDLEAIMQNQTNDPLPAHLSSLATFYDVATDYIQEMSDLMPAILDRPTRPVTPGRVIILSHGKHFNQLGVFLNLQGPHLYPYKVLVLDLDYEEDESVTIEKTEAWYTVCGVARGVNIIGFNQATLKHKIVCVGAKNISMISTTVIKSDYNLIIQDVEKRQMPRFKNDKPGNTCLEAVKKLSSLSYDVYNGIKKLDVINLMSGLNILNGEILQSFERVKDAREKLAEFSGITSMANFQKTFSVVFERKQKEREHQRLKRLLSYEAMALYPDYVRRLDVLKELRYVDDQNRVAMKGRVACEMKTNELIITELVFRNILTDLESEKIAALLSCLVFQARTNSDTPIESSLHESIKKIKEIDEELSTVEAKYQVGVDDPACLSERLNFGLVQVVYEWAKGKPFAEIVSLTDVQEGIIVRNIQQLHEVLSNVRDAAKIIGDPMLQAKMEEVSSSIKRDIVFFASLYTQEDVLEI